MNATQISVLMSVYIKEAPSNLDEALRSIYNQTLLPEEVVLVEDGALTKELYEIIEKWEKIGSEGDKSIPLRRVRLKENVKLGRALAAGLKRCQGEYVARMDSDDIARPKRLEHEYAYMQSHPELSVVGTDIEEFATDGSIKRRVKHMPESSGEVYRYGKLRNPVNHMSVMFKRTDVEAVGGYHHFPLLEDYELWSRMLSSGYKLGNVPETLMEARIDHDFAEKRGGIKYLGQYKKLRSLQLQLGYINRLEYGKGLIVSTVMLLIPKSIRNFVYMQIRKQ